MKKTRDEKHQTHVQTFINHHHHGYYIDHVRRNEPEWNMKGRKWMKGEREKDEGGGRK